MNVYEYDCIYGLYLHELVEYISIDGVGSQGSQS